MSENRSSSASLLVPAALGLLLSSCALTPASTTFQQPPASAEATSERSNVRIYGTISTSITHSTR